MSYPSKIQNSKSITAFLPALAVAAVLLVVNWYFLWETRADQISGDVLIHLIFARNFAEGRWFEFSMGQMSRANTTFLWEWILAVLGILTNLVRSQEGFLTLARALAIACTGFAAWKSYQWGRSLGLSMAAASLTCVFVFLNPATFYWTAVNPMETALALVCAVLTAMWIGRDDLETWKSGLVGGLLVFGLSQTRPEMLAAGPIAAVALILGRGLKRWRTALMVLAIPAALTALVAVWLALSGFPVMPSSSVARRLMMLTYDASPLPILRIPANLDAIKLLILWGPLLLVSLFTAFFGDLSRKSLHFFVLGICVFSGLFFSFFQFTTWQGRYMLPALVILVIPAVAEICRVIKLKSIALSLSASTPGFDSNSKIQNPKILWASGLGYGLLLCALSMKSLAGYADAPNQRKMTPSFIDPPPEAKIFLVQEVQSAYFHPELLHISSEGLISPEAYQAYKRGKTLYEFIMELRPDLVGFGNYYLKDPEGLQQMINSAAVRGENLSYRGLTLKYLGEIAGAGPIFKASYTPGKE